MAITWVLTITIGPGKIIFSESNGMKVNSRASVLGGFLLAGMLGATAANAASVTYWLDDANWKSHLPDDSFYYVSVTIDDEGASGDINFTVDVNDGGLVTPGTGSYGIDKFAFNIADSSTLIVDNIDLGPLTGWTPLVNPDGITRASFGKFDVGLQDTGNPQDPLQFSIIDVDGDTISSYGAASAGATSGGDLNSWFAVHVRDIVTNNYSLPDGNECFSLSTDCQPVTSAWFGGGSDGERPPSNIPVPAAVWLFGSGLLGLVGVARRKKS